MKHFSVLPLVGDREGGAFCSAHVIRQHRSGASSFFTSLRRTPRPPDQVTLLGFDGRKAEAYLAKGGGWPMRRGQGGETGSAGLGGHERRRPPATLGAREPSASHEFHASQVRAIPEGN